MVGTSIPGAASITSNRGSFSSSSMVVGLNALVPSIKDWYGQPRQFQLAMLILQVVLLRQQSCF